MGESLSWTSCKFTLPHKYLVTSPVGHKTSQDFVATTINGLGVSPVTKTGPRFSKSLCRKSLKNVCRDSFYWSSLLKLRSRSRPDRCRLSSGFVFRRKPKFRSHSDVPTFRRSDVPKLTKSVQPRSRRHFNCRSWGRSSQRRPNKVFFKRLQNWRWRRGRESVCVRERVSECACVFEWERARTRERERERERNNNLCYTKIEMGPAIKAVRLIGRLFIFLLHSQSEHLLGCVRFALLRQVSVFPTTLCCSWDLNPRQ